MKSTTLLTATAAIALIAGAASAQNAPAAPTAPAAPPAASGAAPTTAAPSASGDIIETAKAAGQFTTFLKAVDATNLTSVLKTNNNLTVFAPTDAAFAAMPAGELNRLMLDKSALQKLLTHHIINARVDSSMIKGARGEVATVAGDKVMLDGSGDKMLAGNADIVGPDIVASNGIIHVVDKVIEPGAAPSAATSGAPAASASGAPASTTAADAGQAPSSSAVTSKAPASGAAAQKGK